LSERIREGLDGDVTSKPRITRTVHLSHPSGTDTGRDFVRAKSLSVLKRHFQDYKPACARNMIESPHSGVRRRTHNVSRWRDSDMGERWVASAWLLTEKHFRRIDRHEHLWRLAAILGRETNSAKKEKLA
jgi:hypothetical protein